MISSVNGVSGERGGRMRHLLGMHDVRRAAHKEDWTTCHQVGYTHAHVDLVCFFVISDFQGEYNVYTHRT